MDKFNIDEFINTINAIKIDKSDEEWPEPNSKSLCQKLMLKFY